MEIRWGGGLWVYVLGELEQVEFICGADINCLFHCD